MGDRGPSRGESRSTGHISSEYVDPGGWSDRPVALSYSSEANPLDSSSASAITAFKDAQHHFPQCAYDSLIVNRFHQSMDCGGSWKGFRGVNGGE